MPTIKIKETDWITIGQAVHLLAHDLGGNEAAEAVIKGRIRQNKLKLRASCSLINTRYTRALTTLGKIPEPSSSLSEEKPGRVLYVALGTWTDNVDAVSRKERWNWEVGSCIIDTVTTISVQSQHLNGLRVVRPEVELLLPRGAIAEKSNRRINSGRLRSEDWIDWTAELARYLHEEGVDLSKSENEMMKSIADALTERGKSSPSDATVRPTVQAIRARMADILKTR